jgi:glycosyltransferase involved in cell wall biosynthesis
MAVCAGNNPVAEAAIDATDKAELRRRLGLPVEGRIAIRLGRPDPRKWSDLLAVHGAALAQDIPALYLLLLSAPDNRAAVLRRLLGDRAILAPFTTDHETITAYLGACDVMLHYARYGESFGYALAEAGAAGLPVVALATPWGDNAQLELVRHGETGFIANDYAEIRLYLERLLGDPALAARMGETARAHILATYGVGATWRLLDAFIAHVRTGAGGMLREPTDLAADQAARLARGIAAYGERFPRLARAAAERPLYAKPWFWRLAAADLSMVLRRRMRARRAARRNAR